MKLSFLLKKTTDYFFQTGAKRLLNNKQHNAVFTTSKNDARATAAEIAGVFRLEGEGEFPKRTTVVLAP